MIFDEALRHTLRIEGGYSNDPLDSGGATNYGVTERLARKYGYTGLMQALPLETAKAIYRKEFWEPIEGDALGMFSEALALEVFDSAVNVGVSRASEWLQRALNVFNGGGTRYPDIKVDGDIGTNTLLSLAAYSAQREMDVLLKALNCLQGAFYITLAERRSKDERFIYGWIKQRISLA